MSAAATSAAIHWLANDFFICTSGRNLDRVYTRPGWVPLTIGLDGVGYGMVIRHPAQRVSALFELAFQALDLVAEFGEAAGHGKLVDKEDGPNGDPGGKQKMESVSR